MADLVDWLAENRHVIEDVKKVGSALAGEVLREVDLTAGGTGRTRRRRALTNHFWCDLLAAFAWALEKFNRLPKRILGVIASAIFEKRSDDRAASIDQLATQVAVNKTAELITSLSPYHPDSMLMAVRILAILICPAPESHRAVANYCIAPLTKGVISKATKERLDKIFPSDWLSEIRTSLVL